MTDLKKHEFYLDEDGKVDLFRMYYDYHNGPQCMKCKEAFCHHCEPERMEEACYNQDDYLF